MPLRKGAGVQIKSQALDANIASYHVDVTIDAKYAPLQEVMSRYFGLTESLNTFLKELCHPYRNWLFIVQEARGFSLDYFHLLKKHPKGPEVAGIFMDVFFSAVEANTHLQVSSDAIDNLLLYVQTVLKGADEEMQRFAPVVNACFERIGDFSEEDFTLFIRSYYQISKIARALLQNNGHDPAGCAAVNDLLIKYYRRTYEYWLSEVDPLQWLINETGQADLSKDLERLLDGVIHADIRQEQATLEGDRRTGKDRRTSHPGAPAGAKNLQSDRGTVSSDTPGAAEGGDRGGKRKLLAGHLPVSHDEHARPIYDSRGEPARYQPDLNLADRA